MKTQEQVRVFKRGLLCQHLLYAKFARVNFARRSSLSCRSHKLILCENQRYKVYPDHRIVDFLSATVRAYSLSSLACRPVGIHRNNE